MVLDGIVALRKAKSYVDESLLGGGAIVGKNVQVSKIEPIIGGNKITFTYTLDDGTQNNSYLEVMNGERGISVVSSYIESDGNLFFTLSNGETISAGKITIDSTQINLEKYYTKEETDKKFVQSIELDDLISQKLDNKFIAASSEDINSLFK